MSARALSKLALALWAASLLLPALVANEGVFAGLYILALGWMTGGGCVAWWANLCLIPAFRAVRLEKPTHVHWVVLAALLSLDTFRLTGIPSAVGVPPLLYGYGLGALLWFASILILWIATGQKMVAEAIADERSPTQSAAFRGAGAAALVILIGLTATKATLDRVTGNEEEQRRLSLVDFDQGAALVKRGFVCNKEPFRARALVYPDGVIDMTDAVVAEPDGTSPLDLLAQGASVIRVNQLDYRRASDHRAEYFEARQGHGEAAVRVTRTVQPAEEVKHRQKTLKVGIPSSGREASYVWEQSGTADRSSGELTWRYETCPALTYEDGLEVGLLLQLLGLSGRPDQRIGNLVQEMLKNEAVHTRPVVPILIDGLGREALDTGCSADVRIGEGPEGQYREFLVPYAMLGYPLQLGSTRFFHPFGATGRTLHCSDDFGYLAGYNHTVPSGELDREGRAQYSLKVRKIGLDDGHVEWTLEAPLSAWLRSDPTGQPPLAIRVEGVRDTSRELLVSLSIVWREPAGPEERYPTKLALSVPLDGFSGATARPPLESPPVPIG